jgi:hypothetical protein
MARQEREELITRHAGGHGDGAESLAVLAGGAPTARPLRGALKAPR